MLSNLPIFIWALCARAWILNTVLPADTVVVFKL